MSVPPPPPSRLFVPELWTDAFLERLKPGLTSYRPHGRLWQPHTELDQEADALLNVAGVTAWPSGTRASLHWQLQLRRNGRTYQTPMQPYITLGDWKRSISVLLDMANGKLDGY